MAVNADKPARWKSDIAQSVDLYNQWFIQFAPQAYRNTRADAIRRVEAALHYTANLTNITAQGLRQNPAMLAVLRLATAPPLARDRLIGLAGVSPTLIRSMEIDGQLPPRMNRDSVDEALQRVAQTLTRMVDPDISPWLESKQSPDAVELHRAATVVADRLCGAVADPIIRNAQEQRQLAVIGHWLEGRGYAHGGTPESRKFELMPPGTFAFRVNVAVTWEQGARHVNIPVDVAIRPHQAQPGDFPLLIEAKSAGDFTNPNKRRKEEAVKIAQLRNTYGARLQFILFLCGYFDTGYLGYEAAEGLDWVWEHRLDELAQFGV